MNGPSKPMHAAKARRAAQDHAQHVVAAHVAGQRPIGNEEGRRARMIGNHAIGHDVLFDFGIGMARQFLRLVNQRQEQIGLVVGIDALQDRHDALEAHAGIDVLGGQRMQFRRAGALVLNEHQIPDFQEARAIAVDAAHVTGHVLLVAILRAAIVVNLAVGTARPDLGHFPEVFFAAEEQQMRLDRSPAACASNSRLRRRAAPRPARLQSTWPTGGSCPAPTPRSAIATPTRWLPSCSNRQTTSCPASRRTYGGSVAAHVVQVVVLARHAHALLRIGHARVRPRAQTQEHILELHHARVGEQQGIIAQPGSAASKARSCGRCSSKNSRN